MSQLSAGRHHGAALGAGPRASGRVAEIIVHDELAATAPLWQAMQRAGALATPYQQYALARLWDAHVARAAGARTVVVSAHASGGTPLLLWPLTLERRGPARILRYFGGRHANLNFGLWERHFAASARADELDAVLAGIAGSGLGADLLVLERQPATWDGVANPLLQLPHQQSANPVRSADLRALSAAPLLEQLGGGLRRDLQRKERRLARLPGFRYVRATSAAERTALLDWFFRIKPARLAAQGVTNIYDDPGIVAFIRGACEPGPEVTAPALELHALLCDTEILAMLAGVRDERRFSTMFSARTLSENARQSPGLVLLYHTVADLIARGHVTFDLGAGEAPYKELFCKQVEPLFDSFLPLTATGRLAALAMSTQAALKREVKRNHVLWSAAQRLRRHLHARG